MSPGFCATIFADNLGHVRHMAVAPNGVVYVNTWSGRYFRYDTPPTGGFVLALKDSKGVGVADIIERFGDGVPEGSAGGSGVAFYKGAVYAEQNDKILRYAIPEGSIVPKDRPEVVVSDLPLTGDHPMHPFVIDPQGNIYIDLGSATNSCQVDNRKIGSPGIDPCVEQETRGGTWRYDANKTGQKFSAAERFATGIRNGEGFSFDASGKLYATQHGRDQARAALPHALYRCAKRGTAGRGSCPGRQGRRFRGLAEMFIFDGMQKKLVLAPEYGGDGARRSVSAREKTPGRFLPGALGAERSLDLYRNGFPTAYQGGLFVAFHGSWNRAPAPQGGYDVVFQPMKGRQDDGRLCRLRRWLRRAVKETRPLHITGPAVWRWGPDGALYVADDQKGRIWRVTYHGGADAPIAPAPASKGRPWSLRSINCRMSRSCRSRLARTREQIVAGDKIFHGQMSDGTCLGCHGSDAKGTAQGPSLVSGNFVQGRRRSRL